MIPAKKLFLASAVAALSTTGFAMESMDDDSLSATTGQDGITLSLSTPASGISAEIRLHDSDGVSTNFAAGVTGPGALIIGGSNSTSTAVKAQLIVPTTAPISIAIDAGSTGGTSSVAVLNVNVSIPTGTTIHTGTIAVAQSAGMGAAISNETGVIMNDTTIVLGSTTANIQLGNAPQGAMIVVNTTMTGGLTLNSFSLNDASSSGGGSLAATKIVMCDTGAGAACAGGTGTLTVKATAGVKSTGFYVTPTQLGTASGFDMQITALKFGTTPAIGNVEVIGLNVNNSTLTVAGH